MSLTHTLAAVALVLASLSVQASQPTTNPETALPGLCDIIKNTICDLGPTK